MLSAYNLYQTPSSPPPFLYNLKRLGLTYAHC